MELEVNKKNSYKTKFQTITGFLSFLFGLIGLAGMNAYLLLKAEVVPEFIFDQLPLLGIVMGIIGLFTKKRSRMYAWWGIGLNLFIYVFLFIMIGLAWTINAKP